MIDLENLTIVESLTINALLMQYMSVDHNRNAPDFADAVGIYSALFESDTLSQDYLTDIYTVGDLYQKIIINNSWINRAEYRNHCLSMRFPAVKLPGYTKARALKEARNTIQFVKDRMKTI